jgi:anaerobic dimethyl sulfoxide reductase subunit A
VNSSLILLWGVSPATSIFSTNTSYYLAQAREAGARIVVIDPRYTDTAAAFADEWIPIKPGTDAAMMAAMAYVMISENLQDQRFLEKYTVGFDRYKEYVRGIEDGIAKTPIWAEAKTGVPADTIVSLARQYASTKPAALIPGYAPGRTAYGEQFHRAASTLAAMTGNIGIHGGGAAGFERGLVGPHAPPAFFQMKDGATYDEQVKALDVDRRLRNQPHYCTTWDFIIKGAAGGYSHDIKMAYISGANPLNQLPHINKGVEALQKLEFIVVHELFMTATARYADILLPVTTHWERNDFTRPWLSGPYFLYLNKVIEPLYEARNDRDICRDLAKRLDIEQPGFDLPEEECIQQWMGFMGDMTEETADFNGFKESGVSKIKLGGPQVCFEQQIEDPETNPFPTPSGKIEIYCQRIADLHNPDIPPIPKYIDPWEGPEDLLAHEYPLQLITIHEKTRAHSCFDNSPLLNELETQKLWISTGDAQSRGISDGDLAVVYNDRGKTIVPAYVTGRIMPGVVSLGEGAWYTPDENGRDRAGSPNILTRDCNSPGGAFASNTSLVQVGSFRLSEQ